MIPLTTGLGSSWDRGLPISVSFDPDGYKVVYEKLTSKKSKFSEVLVDKDGVVSKRSSKIKDSEVIDFELEYNTDIDDNGWIGSFNNELQSENDKSLILSTDV